MKKAKDDANREFEEKLATNSEEISEKETENIENNVHDEETLHMDSDSDNEEENEEEINLSDSENLDMASYFVYRTKSTAVYMLLHGRDTPINISRYYILFYCNVKRWGKYLKIFFTFAKC